MMTVVRKNHVQCGLNDFLVSDSSHSLMVIDTHESGFHVGNADSGLYNVSDMRSYHVVQGYNVYLHSLHFSVFFI